MYKNMTYKQAEQAYAVPAATIFHRIKGRCVPLNKMGAGRSTALSLNVELDLVNCIKTKARMGCPYNKQDVINVVAEFVKINNLKTPFTNGVSGHDWYYAFMARHPSLSFKKTRASSKVKKRC